MYFHVGFMPIFGMFRGGIGFIFMFLAFMFVMSLLRRSFYGGGHSGYRRYHRPYQRPGNPRYYQGQGQNTNGQNGNNNAGTSHYSGQYGAKPANTVNVGNMAPPEDTGVKTVR